MERFTLADGLGANTQTNIRHIGTCNACLQRLKHYIYTNFIQTHCRVQFQCQINICANTHNHTQKKNKSTLNQRSARQHNNSVGTSRVWQKNRHQDAIQTVIKTKYASFLAQCRGDQWEIGRNMRNVCFCYRQPSLMFLIGSE